MMGFKFILRKIMVKLFSMMQAIRLKIYSIKASELKVVIGGNR